MTDATQLAQLRARTDTLAAQLKVLGEYCCQVQDALRVSVPVDDGYGGTVTLELDLRSTLQQHALPADDAIRDDDDPVNAPGDSTPMLTQLASRQAEQHAVLELLVEYTFELSKHKHRGSALPPFPTSLLMAWRRLELRR